MDDRRALLNRTAEIAGDFLDELPTRPVGQAAELATLRAALGGPLPDAPSDPEARHRGAGARRGAGDRRLGGPALLRVRRRGRRARGAGRRLARPAPGTRTTGCTCSRPRLRWSRRSPANGWSTCSGSRAARASGSRPAQRWRPSPGWRRAGTRCSNVPAGTSRRTATSGRRQSRSSSVTRRTSRSSRRCRCWGSGAHGSIASRRTGRAGCVPTRCARRSRRSMGRPRLRPGRERQHRRVRSAAGDRRRGSIEVERVAPRRWRLRPVGRRRARAPGSRGGSRGSGLVDDRYAQVAQRPVRLRGRDLPRPRVAPPGDVACRLVLRPRRGQPARLDELRAGVVSACPWLPRLRGASLARPVRARRHDRSLLRARAADGGRPPRHRGRDDPQRRRAQPGPGAILASEWRRRSARPTTSRDASSPRSRPTARAGSAARPGTGWRRCASRSRTGPPPRPTLTCRSRRSSGARRKSGQAPASLDGPWHPRSRHLVAGSSPHSEKERAMGAVMSSQKVNRTCLEGMTPNAHPEPRNPRARRRR